jgi:DNA repair photolyase
MSAKIEGNWHKPLTVTPNNFIYKSLSNWACNIAVGCEHKCTFCYVPSASTNKLAGPLGKLGVTDPDQQWGDYVFLRPWIREEFMKSLRAAERTPAEKLAPDGNRAIMFCTTTDPYQTFKKKALNEERVNLVRQALLHILTNSTLNVRILTRSPLAREDFDIYKEFGPRLMFGMSIPTLDNRLAKIYEPNAPAPSQRLETLKMAEKLGLHTYVAVAPAYPECGFEDMANTLVEIKKLEVKTIFFEPINIRAQNVERIKKRGEELGVRMRSEVFKDTATWKSYAYDQLVMFESLCQVAKVENRMHLWPDKSLSNPRKAEEWLNGHWQKISYWPR